MHDLFEAQKILKKVIEKAQEAGAKKINSASIGIGSIIEHGEELLPETIKFNLEKLSEGTIAQGARFDVRKIEGDIWKLDEMDVD